MANKYIYYYDKERGKKVYGGKYGALNDPRRRTFDVENAEEERKKLLQAHLRNVEEKPVSQRGIYVFSDRVHGTRRIEAASYKEALAKAKLWGFEDRDYQGMRRKRGRRR